MTTKVRLNKTNLDKQKPPADGRLILWDSDLTGLGVRIMPTGAKTLFFQCRADGELIRVTIGRYTGEAASIEQARVKAKQMAAKAAAGVDPRDASKKRGAHTFGDLLTAYADMLEAVGKESAKAVRNALQRNVEEAFPRLWAKPANAVDIDDCVKIVGKLHDDKKPRQADKIRAYLKAAFTVAINARGNVKAPAVLRDIGIRTNPARDIQKVEGSSNADNRALSLSELRCYWTRVKQQPEPARSLSMLHMLTGGQRMKQLSRVTVADIDRDAMLMLMRDGKGRRPKQRVYGVPLLPQALECIDNITGGGEFVFSADGGQSPIGTSYLTGVTKRICTDMDKAKELEGTPFTGKHIRSTVETRLMGKPYRVTSDVFKRLLSHGMGGVQEKYYAHDAFHDEQLEALQMLWRMVNDIPEPGMRLAEVVKLEARA